MYILGVVLIVSFSLYIIFEQLNVQELDKSQSNKDLTYLHCSTIVVRINIFV